MPVPIEKQYPRAYMGKTVLSDRSDVFSVNLQDSAGEPPVRIEVVDRESAQEILDLLERRALNYYTVDVLV